MNKQMENMYLENMDCDDLDMFFEQCIVHHYMRTMCFGGRDMMEEFYGDRDISYKLTFIRVEYPIYSTMELKTIERIK